MALLTCPGCGRGGLRVPDGRRGKVTCPRCGAEWFYPETIELSEVEFRCGQSGARFIVQLSRRSPTHKFVIQGITNAPSRPSGETRSNAATAQEKAVLTDSVPVPQLAKSKSGRWLAILFGKSSPAVAPIPRSSDLAGPTAPARTALRHDASEYNWSSFICPYCNASSFVRCSGGHLACDGPVEMRSGRRFHQCYCGNAGFIEGTIRSIEAKQHAFEAAIVASTNPAPPTVKSSSAPSLGSPPEKTGKQSLVASVGKNTAPTRKSDLKLVGTRDGTSKE